VFPRSVKSIASGLSKLERVARLALTVSATVTAVSLAPTTALVQEAVLGMSAAGPILLAPPQDGEMFGLGMYGHRSHYSHRSHSSSHY